MPVARRSRTPRAVLILAHARDRGAVTAARALRRAGWRVGLGSSRADGGLAGASDAVHALHPVPRPSGEQGAFLRGLGAALAEGRYDVVVGSGDDWMAALAHHRERLTATVAHPAAAVVAAGMDKLTLHRMAQDAGLATPATRTLAPEPWQEVALPVVVKNRRHWTPHHDRRHRIETAVCSTSAELERHLLAFASEYDEPVLQEPVDGVLSALIGVVHEGRLTGRVQQVSPCVFPTPSGASARARTVPVDPVLAERCELLLGRLGWSGLVELQFLVGRDGVHRLIDLNGRFFGSLALAEAARPGLVDAGLRAGAGMPVPELADGRPGMRYQWLPGDLRRAVQERRGGVVADVFGSLRWGLGARHSVADPRDPGPVLRLLAGRLLAEPTEVVTAPSAAHELSHDLQRHEALRRPQDRQGELVAEGGGHQDQQGRGPDRFGVYGADGEAGQQRRGQQRESGAA